MTVKFSLLLIVTMILNACSTQPRGLQSTMAQTSLKSVYSLHALALRFNQGK